VRRPFSLRAVSGRSAAARLARTPLIPKVGAPRAPDTPSPGRPTRRVSRTGRPGLPRERRAAPLRRAGRVALVQPPDFIPSAVLRRRWACLSMCGSGRAPICQRPCSSGGLIADSLCQSHEIARLSSPNRLCVRGF
jgi:hypothetical protein